MIFLRNRIKYFIFFFTLIMLSGCENKENNLSYKIINVIDSNSEENGECEINMNEITDLKYDKILIYGIGISNSEVSETLGFDYNKEIDLMNGIIFIYNDKIVYEESILYNPERSEKFEYILEHKVGEPKCKLYNADESIFTAKKYKIDDNYYYKLIAK